MNSMFMSVLLMSLTGTALCLVIIILRPATRRVFGASWHYRACTLVVLFLLIPVSAVGGPIFSAALNSTGGELPQISSALTQLLTAPDDAAPVTDSGKQAVVFVQPVSVHTGSGQNAAEAHGMKADGATEENRTALTGNASKFDLRSLLPYLPYIWPAGAGFFIAVQLIKHARFKRRLTRTNLPVEDESVYALLNDCLCEMGIHRKVGLMSSSIVTTPMLMGIYRSVLILPEIDMDDKELRMVLRHELTHFKRFDILIKLLALLANAVHWFNPLAYRLRRELDTYCELSCDERVVSELDAEGRRFYGETILNVLCRVTKKREGLFAAFAASRRGFERRLTRIMDYKKTSKRAASFSLALLFLLGLIGCGAGGLAGAKMEATKELTVCIDAAVHTSLAFPMRAFRTDNPNVKVKYVILPDYSLGASYKPEDRETQLTQLRTQVMAGQGPDLFLLQSDMRYRGLPAIFQDPEKAMRGGVFCDVLPLFRQAEISMDDFITPVMEAGQVDGKQYIVPLNYQVFGVMTNDTTWKTMGDDAFQNPAAMLEGLRALTETPDVSMLLSEAFSNLRQLLYDPFYAISPYPVDYDTLTARIDTPLLRDILESSKLAIKKSDAPIADHQPDLTSEFWKTYIQSDFFIIGGALSSLALQGGISEKYAEYTPHLDVFPTEDGGVRGSISLYAGIRANSSNKLNAVNLLKTLLSETYQTKANDGSSWDFGWPVRKGVLAEHLKTYVDKGKTWGIGYSANNNGKPVSSMTVVGFTAPLSEESVNSFLAIEAKITSAAFSPPIEIRNILDSYLSDEIDLDTAIVRMQDYWDKSLEE